VGVDWDKNLYVTDSGNDRIQIFDKSGKFKTQWQQKTDYDRKLTGRSFGIGSEEYKEYLRPFTSEPRHITGFDQIHAADRVPLKQPTGFCLLGSSSNGEIFLADTENHKIKRLSSGSGYLYSSTGQKGSDLGCLKLPADTAYDLEKDQLIVADAGNNRIQIYQLSSHGEFFHTNAMIGTQQINDQGLSNPMAVAVLTEQPNQFIYIADTGNNRVIKLQNGLFLPGASPVDVWEKFKDALRKEDIEKALTFITPFAREQYSKVLQHMKPHLKEFVNSMGKLTPESIESGSAHYELSHTDPNGKIFVFPVHFSLDDQGSWTISLF
jgi:DNA-binding beta-propeller fold protein YncE